MKQKQRNTAHKLKKLQERGRKTESSDISVTKKHVKGGDEKKYKDANTISSIKEVEMAKKKVDCRTKSGKKTSKCKRKKKSFAVGKIKIRFDVEEKPKKR